MSESASDGECSSSFHVALSRLVIWAHTHGTICNQIPALEFMQNMDHLSNGSAVLWMCRVGHAYHWQCEKLHDRGTEEAEAVGRRRRFLSSESLSREAILGEKRLKLTPSSFERDQADAGSTRSSDRCQGVTEEEADRAYMRNNEPRGHQNTRKPIISHSAVEQHFSASGGGVQIGKQDLKFKSDNDLQIISVEEQCKADEDNQGDKTNQDNVSESSAEVDLKMLHCQKMALQQPTTPQRAPSDLTARPPLTRAYILQVPVNNPEDPSRNILRLGPFSAAGPVADTSRATSLPGSAASQQHPQLSPPECGTLGMGSSGDSTESVAEGSETSGLGQTPCSSAFQSSESHPPAASNRDVLKNQESRKRYTIGDMKVFQEWLALHHPSETRQIHTLPPADLDHYLVLFLSSAKRRDGKDFSANSLNFIQRSIDRYLKEHNYQYSILRGTEFRASQKAWKSKQWCLLQKDREEEWSVVENLTDEDVKKLLKNGILSKMNPQGLLHLMFTNLIRGFGASTHSQTHQLNWGQLVLMKTRGEVEYLVWKDDLSPEGNEGEPSPRLFAKPKDPENCPVASYKEYASRRPPDMLSDNSPLYLSPKSLCSVWDKVWYTRKALTKAKMEKILKIINKEVRGAIRKTRK